MRRELKSQMDRHTLSAQRSTRIPVLSKITQRTVSEVTKKFPVDSSEKSSTKRTTKEPLPKTTVKDCSKVGAAFRRSKLKTEPKEIPRPFIAPLPKRLRKKPALHDTVEEAAEIPNILTDKQEAAKKDEEVQNEFPVPLAHEPRQDSVEIVGYYNVSRRTMLPSTITFQHETESFKRALNSSPQSAPERATCSTKRVDVAHVLSVSPSFSPTETSSTPTLDRYRGDSPSESDFYPYAAYTSTADSDHALPGGELLETKPLKNEPAEIELGSALDTPYLSTRESLAQTPQQYFGVKIAHPLTNGKNPLTDLRVPEGFTLQSNIYQPWATQHLAEMQRFGEQKAHFFQSRFSTLPNGTLPQQYNTTTVLPATDFSYEVTSTDRCNSTSSKLDLRGHIDALSALQDNPQLQMCNDDQQIGTPCSHNLAGYHRTQQPSVVSQNRFTQHETPGPALVQTLQLPRAAMSQVAVTTKNDGDPAHMQHTGINNALWGSVEYGVLPNNGAVSRNVVGVRNNEQVWDSEPDLVIKSSRVTNTPSDWAPLRGNNSALSGFHTARPKSASPSDLHRESDNGLSVQNFAEQQNAFWNQNLTNVGQPQQAFSDVHSQLQHGGVGPSGNAVVEQALHVNLVPHDQVTGRPMYRETYQVMLSSIENLPPCYFGWYQYNIYLRFIHFPTRHNPTEPITSDPIGPFLSEASENGLTVRCNLLDSLIEVPFIKGMEVRVAVFQEYGNRCDLVGRARLLFNVNLDQINEEYVTLMDRNKVPVEGIGCVRGFFNLSVVGHINAAIPKKPATARQQTDIHFLPPLKRTLPRERIALGGNTASCTGDGAVSDIFWSFVNGVFLDPNAQPPPLLADSRRQRRTRARRHAPRGQLGVFGERSLSVFCMDIPDQFCS